MTAEEIEMELAKQMQVRGWPEPRYEAPRPTSTQPSYTPDEEERMRRVEEGRRKRLLKMAKSQRYDNLMSNADKEYISRIQISQLVSVDPYAEDFYYQVFSVLQNRKALPPLPGLGPSVPMDVIVDRPLRGGKNWGRMRAVGVEKMQQQVQKMVHEAKTKPRVTQVTMEGALGLIVKGSSRNPKKTLQVGKQSTASEVPTSSVSSSTYRKKVLKMTENVYDAVLSLEQMRRDHLKLENEADIEEWKAMYAAKVDALWNLLQISDPLANVDPYPLASMLSLGKGRRIFARILRHMTPERSLTMVYAFFHILTRSTFSETKRAPRNRNCSSAPYFPPSLRHSMTVH